VAKRKAKKRDKWARPVGVEREYQSALKKVARTAGSILEGSAEVIVSGKTVPPSILASLSAYEQALIPWAEQITRRLFQRIDNDARRAFISSSKEIFKGIRGTIANTAAGAKMKELQAAQVELIKSIPREAAERAQRLAREAMTEGRRFEDIVKDIQDSGKVSEGRARVIARTETAKANATFTQARAQAVGSGGYYWRTMEDEAVRESHQEMADRSNAGEIFSWDSPPEVEPGEFHHPGGIYNCFVGSEKISLLNGCRALLKHFYSGDIVKIYDSGGGTISATPNHPVMTVNGWVPVESLNTGDYIVQVIDNRSVVQDNKKNLITTFDDLYRSLSILNSREIRLIRGCAFDLHNYIPDGHVNNIRPDAFLSDYAVSEAFKALRDFSFTIPDSYVIDIGAFCGYGHVMESNITRFFNQVAAICCAHVEHANCVCFRSCAPDNIIFYEDISNTFTGTPIFFRQGQFAKARHVFIDNCKLRQVIALIEACGGSVFYHDTPSAEVLGEIVRMTANTGSGVLDRGPVTYKLLSVVDKSFANFSGHVYTLESFCGYYTTGSNNIASKNCRCYAEPLLPDLESL